MAIGKFSDPEWKGVSIGFLALAALNILFVVMMTYAIGVPLSLLAAPDANDMTLNPAYGFWVRGNVSFWSPGVMNHTDMNASSPTYMHWIPPPEWRDLCIESSGVPIAACSYFQHQEAPGFMTFFYTIMYLCEATIFISRFVLMCLALKQLMGCLARTRKYDGGLQALTTVWGMEKSPECTQYSTFKYTQAITTLWAMGGVLFVSYISMMSDEGFGLMNSFDTDSLYFGAKWNEFPIETRENAGATDSFFHWTVLYFARLTPGVFIDLFPPMQTMFWWAAPSGASFAGQVSTSFLSNQVMYDAVFDFHYVMSMYVLSFVYIGLIKSRLRVKTDTIIQGDVRCWAAPTDPSKWSSWMQEFRAGPFGHPGCIIATLLQITFTAVIGTSMPIVSHPSFALNGDQGMLGWLQFTHFATAVMVVAIVAFCVSVDYFFISELKKELRDSKHLMSAVLFKIRYGSIVFHGRMFYAVYSVYVCFFTILLPGGMAMQVYGIQDPTSWPCIFNGVFSQAGSATNMLGAPAHFLMVKVVTLFFFFFAWGLRPFKILGSNRPH